MKNKYPLIVTISSLNDLDKIKSTTKYINFDLTNIDHEVISYFLEYGENYLYSETIDSNSGYIYVGYQDFKNAENIISMIYANMPNDLNKLEMARYIYIALAKCLHFDINLDQNKNETCPFEILSTINNIWGSISLGRVTDISASKIYYYLCKRLGIDISLLTNYQDKEASNKLKIDNHILFVDLYQDIPFIQANMSTKNFNPYNTDINLDKKIKYIKNNYIEYYLDKSLKNIDYNSPLCIEKILNVSSKLINIDTISPVELSIIYRYIFKKYCPNYDISINNLYLANNTKKHFIMISYELTHYSYNYKKKTFIKVSDNDIINNIKTGKIGLYLNELIPNIPKITNVRI